MRLYVYYVCLCLLFLLHLLCFLLVAFPLCVCAIRQFTFCAFPSFVIIVYILLFYVRIVVCLLPFYCMLVFRRLLSSILLSGFVLLVLFVCSFCCTLCCVMLYFVPFMIVSVLFCLLFRNRTLFACLLFYAMLLLFLFCCTFMFFSVVYLMFFTIIFLFFLCKCYACFIRVCMCVSFIVCAVVIYYMCFLT